MLLYNLSHMMGFGTMIDKRTVPTVLFWTGCFDLFIHFYYLNLYIKCITIHGMHYLVSFLNVTDLFPCCWIIYWEYSSTFRILPLIIDENLEKEEKSSGFLHEGTVTYITTNS